MKKAIKGIGKNTSKESRICLSYLLVILILPVIFCITGCRECCPVIESFTLSPSGAGAGDVVNLSFDVCWYEDGNTRGERCKAQREFVQIRFMPSETAITRTINWTVTSGGGCDPVYCYRGTVSGVNLRPGDSSIQVRVSAEEGCPHRPETASISY